MIDSYCSQKVVQFKVLPSGKITNFGNLQLSYSIELDSAEGWDENVKLLLTVDCFKHLSLPGQ